MSENNEELTNKELTKKDLVNQQGIVIRGTLEDKLFSLKIDNWEVLQEVKNKIKSIRMDINIKWFQMAKYLYLIWRDKAWKLEGCDSWVEWIAENYEYLGRGVRQVERLIKVWQVLIVDLHQPIKEVSQLSSTNAHEIARYARPSNVKDLLALGKKLETRALKKTLAEMNMEDMSSYQIFNCDHEHLVVTYRCRKCKEVYYRPTSKTKIIVDKAGIIDTKKAREIASDVEIVRDAP